jgi:hypothetical protein
LAEIDSFSIRATLDPEGIETDATKRPAARVSGPL